MSKKNKLKAELVSEVTQLQQRIRELEIADVEQKLTDEALRLSSEESAALLRVSQALNSSLEMKTVLQKTTDNATDLMGIDTAAIYVFEEEEIYLGATTPLLDPKMPENFLRAALVDHPHIQKSFSTGHTVILADTRKADLTDEERAICDARGLRTVVYFPLMVGQRILGTLILGTVGKTRNFTEAEINLGRTLANQVAISVQNASLHEESKEYSKELEDQIGVRKLAEAELLLKDLVFEYSLTANSISDKAGVLTHVNDAFIKIWGYESKSEVIGKLISDLLNFQEEAKNIITALDETGEWEGEYTALRKDGTTFYAQGLATIISDESGNTIGYQSAVLDITERKQAEDRTQHLNLVLYTIRKVNQLIVEEKDREALIQKACKLLTKNRGYKNAWIVLLGEKGEYLSSAESGLGKRFTLLKKMLEKGELTVCGSKALEKRVPVIVVDPAIECGDCPLSKEYDGMSGFSIRLDFGDKIYGLLTVSVPEHIVETKEELDLFQEIGGDLGFALHNIEVGKKREQAEEALWESEERYRAVVENSHNGIIILGEDFKFEYVNAPLCQILGRNHEEIIGHDFREFMDEENGKLVADRYLRRQRGEEVLGRYEFYILRKDGAPRRVEISSAIVRDSRGKARMIAQIMDITERARAEEEIQQRTEELTLINAINNAVNCGMDFPEILKLLTGEAKRIFNSKSTTVYLCSEDQKYLEMKNLDMLPGTVKRIEKLVGTSFSNIRIPLKEGSLTKELLHADGPLLINDSEIIQEWMLEFTYAIDLSEKSRLAIQKLISQIYELVGIQSIITVPMISAGEPIGLMDFSRREPFTEGDVKRVAGVVGQVTAAITSLRTEKEKARSQRLLLTLSKAAPAVQRASNAEEIYSAIGEQVVKMGFEVTVFTLSDDKKHLAVSYQSLKSDLLRTIEKLTNLSAKNYSFPLKPEGYFHKIITSKETVFSHLDIKPIEETLPRLLRPLANKVMGLIGKKQSIIAPLAVGGEVHGLLSISSSDLSESDIPAIKTFANQAAIALEKTRLFQETQELATFNEGIIQNMTEGIALQDKEGVFTFVNPAAVKMLGYTSEEWVGMHWKEIVPPDQQPLIRAADERRVRGESDSYELDLVGKDSQRISVLVGGSPRFDVEGNFTGTIGVFTDITGRKRAEEKISRFSRIFEDSLNEIYLFKTDTLKFTQVNRAGQKNLGYTMEELLELTPLDIKPDITAKSFAELVEPLRKSERERVVFEAVHKRKDGSLYDVEVHLQLLHYEKEALFSAIILDITERVRSEDAMLKYTHQLETLNTTTAALSTSLELDHVLELILDQIGQVLPFDSGAIFLHDEGKLLVRADRGNKPSVKGHIFSSENELFQEIQRMGMPLIVNNTKEDPRFQNWGQSENVASWMGVPLMVRDTMIGFLTLDCIQLNAYSDKQADLALTFASQSAQAIENARQVSAAQQRMKQLDALLNIDQAIMGSFDLKVTLHIILEQLLKQLAIDAAVVLIYQADLQTLQFTQGRGFQTAALQYTDLRLGEGYAGEVGLQRDHLFIPDLNQDEGKIQESPQFSKEGFVAYYGVPLIAKGKLVGVLEIFQRSSLDPDNEWVNYLRLLASQVAIAIDNITLFNDLQRSNIDLTLAYDGTIEGWAHALELKDVETEGHSRRVVELTMHVARRMEVGGEKLGHIRRGALLHDIGKMGIPDSILQKPGKLTDEEWQIMRQHPVFAFDWLSPIQYLRPALEIPYAHHERWDGTGYPRGLKGEQIPLAARIFAIVDVWDALNSDRPYRRAWSKEKALDYIKEQSGKHFDPRVVKSFLIIIESDRKAEQKPETAGD